MPKAVGRFRLIIMTVNNIRQELPDNYTGQILQGDYSAFLKTRVTECVVRFRAFDETGNPAIPYISAWGEDDSFIWYEFASRRLLRLLGCPASMAADIMRNNVIERRIYKSPVFDKDVKKESIQGAELGDQRKALREEGQTTRKVEAVYKISLNSGREIWVKDQAAIEIYEEDRIKLSLGCLTIVNKEMALEDKCETLIEELKKSMAEVKTLSGMLPICANCKKIRDDKGYWNEIEAYISSHSETVFSHGICPECNKKLYPELYP